MIRALVIEDDLSWQQILSEILTDAGLFVDLADNLDGALLAIKSDSHRVAIVDLSLAGGDYHNYDGLRILEAFRHLDPDCRTILLTGYATVELAVNVLTEYGAFSFLRKENFQRSQFKDLIQRALARIPPQESFPLESAVSENGSGTAIIPDNEFSGSKILVVEDDAGWRGILSELLADAGYEVRLSASFGDALGNLRRENFSLAVVDLSLSEEVIWGQNGSSGHLEGYELLRETKSTGIPTIVVSGISSVEEIQRAYTEQSIFAFLEKQAFDRATFIRLVRQATKTSHRLGELDSLTEREREVFDLLSSGMTNKEIAGKLVITTNTVKRHIKAIFEKLNVHTRSGAAAKSIG